MKRVLLDENQREACLFEDGVWMRRFLFPETAMLGGVYRLRILQYVPALSAYLLQGMPVQSPAPDTSGVSAGSHEEILLRTKDAASKHKPGDVVLVEVFRDGYDGKRPLATEHLSLDAKIAEALRAQLIFDPVPKKLKTAWDPFSRWLEKNEVDPKKSDAVRKTCLEEDPVAAPQRRYWLGRVIENEMAQIVIDSTEAAHIIDVNQTAASLSIVAEKKAKMVNRASIPLIVRALLLQKRQGIVLIDALRMSSADRSQYLNALRQQIRAERLRAKVLGFTRAGLVEVLVRR